MRKKEEEGLKKKKKKKNRRRRRRKMKEEKRITSTKLIAWEKKTLPSTFHNNKLEIKNKTKT